MQFSITTGLKRTFLPVIWFSVSANVKDDPSIIPLMKFTLKAPLIGTICFFCMFLTGIIVVAVSGYVAVKEKKKKKRRRRVAERETTSVNEGVAANK